MNPEQMAETKKQLRAELKVARRALAGRPEDRVGLIETLGSLAHSLRASTIAAFLPFGDEPDIGGFIAAQLSQGRKIILPISNTDGTLSWVSYTGKTATGIFGFAEPVGPSSNLAEADLIVLPASACDAYGNRIGKGKGFYDRALSADTRAPTAAVIYEPELIDSVPTEPHDRRVDFVVTPQRVLATN